MDRSVDAIKGWSRKYYVDACKLLFDLIVALCDIEAWRRQQSCRRTRRGRVKTVRPCGRSDTEIDRNRWVCKKVVHQASGGVVIENADPTADDGLSPAGKQGNGHSNRATN